MEFVTVGGARGLVAAILAGSVDSVDELLKAADRIQEDTELYWVGEALVLHAVNSAEETKFSKPQEWLPPVRNASAFLASPKIARRLASLELETNQHQRGYVNALLRLLLLFVRLEFSHNDWFLVYDQPETRTRTQWLAARLTFYQHAIHPMRTATILLGDDTGAGKLLLVLANHIFRWLDVASYRNVGSLLQISVNMDRPSPLDIASAWNLQQTLQTSSVLDVRKLKATESIDERKTRETWTPSVRLKLEQERFLALPSDISPLVDRGLAPRANGSSAARLHLIPLDIGDPRVAPKVPGALLRFRSDTDTPNECVYLPTQSIASIFPSSAKARHAHAAMLLFDLLLNHSTATGREEIGQEVGLFRAGQQSPATRAWHFLKNNFNRKEYPVLSINCCQEFARGAPSTVSVSTREARAGERPQKGRTLFVAECTIVAEQRFMQNKQQQHTHWVQEQPKTRVRLLCAGASG